MAMLRHHAVRCMGHVAGIDLHTHNRDKYPWRSVAIESRGLRELEPSHRWPTYTILSKPKGRRRKPSAPANKTDKINRLHEKLGRLKCVTSCRHAKAKDKQMLMLIDASQIKCSWQSAPTTFSVGLMHHWLHPVRLARFVRTGCASCPV